MNYRNIYEANVGPIPTDEEGRTYDIHHLDGDRTNNDPTNLVALSIDEHFRVHYEQGDWMACHAIGLRMKLSPEEISSLSKRTQEERIKQGNHPFVDSEWQSRQGKKANKRRLEQGTHNWLGSTTNQEMLDKGIHPSQQKIECEWCKKVVSIGMYKQWHGDRCEAFTGIKQTRPSPSRETIEKRAKKILGNQFAKGRKWYNDGVTERMIIPGTEPKHWISGRLNRITARPIIFLPYHTSDHG